MSQIFSEYSVVQIRPTLLNPSELSYLLKQVGLNQCSDKRIQAYKGATCFMHDEIKIIINMFCSTFVRCK